MEEVKVLGEDHKIYEVSDFVASGKTYKDAIGIVFGTPIIGLRVLAFDSRLGQWGENYSKLTEYHNEPQAVQVLCGLDDTKRIVEAQKILDEPTAAKWCWEYEKGGFKWYLPSVMELAALFLIRDKVNDAMERLKCDSYYMLPTKESYEDLVWSSSENSWHYSWYVNFDNGNFGTCYKNSTYVVRAVASLVHPITAKSTSDKTNRVYSEMTDEELISQLRNRGYYGKLTKNIQL